LAFPAVENEFALLVTLPEIEEEILEHHRLIESCSRSDPQRPSLLRQLVGLQTQHMLFSGLKSDLDQAITHLTEAVLLPATQDIVLVFFTLATLLLSRFSLYEQPDDVKSAIKYFRFLRLNFHSLEAFDIPDTSGNLSSNLFHALAHNLVLTPGDMVRDLEEVVALIPEVITVDTLTFHQKHAMEAFGEVVTPVSKTVFCREDTQRVADRAIQVLREAMVLNSDLVISCALATFLAARFEMTLVMNDCDDAIAIADKIVATHSLGNSLTTTQKNTIMLISDLLVSRMNSFSRPENLEDAIHRIRTFVPCFPDEDHTKVTLVKVLAALTHQRFQYFGITGTSGEIPNVRWYARVQRTQVDSQETGNESQIQEKIRHLDDIETAI
jgi:hypothetical protein